MKYSVTLMNSKGKEMPDPLRRTQNSIGLAIAYAHKQLDSVGNQRMSALIREINPDKTSRVVRVVNAEDRLTRSPSP
jgi:hypothetical protein